MNTRAYSSKQEKRVAKRLGGKVNSNSGATDFYKGDIRTQEILIECKTTTKEVKSVSIKKAWLDKLDEEKFSMGKYHSALAFDFGDGKDYFIINADLMELVVGYVEDLYNGRKRDEE